MPDLRISQLTAASAALGADEVPINEAGAPKKLTVAQIEAYDGRYDIRTYGAIGGGSTGNAADSAGIQAAIDAAHAVGGGIVWVPNLGPWRCDNVIMRSGVTLTGGAGAMGYRVGAIGMPLLVNTAAGWCIDTPTTGAGGAANLAITGLSIQGPGAGVSSGGIRFQDASWSKISRVGISGFANEGIAIRAGFANTIEDVLALLCVLNTSRAAPIGCVDIDGTDTYISRVESGPLAARATPGLTNAAFYVAAFMLRGYTHFLSNCVGEWADVGYYNLAGQVQVVNCRADHNFGHGWFAAYGCWTLVGCNAFRNGLETPNTYDGFHIADASRPNILVACYSMGDGTGIHRYGLNDLIWYAPSRTVVADFVDYGAGTAPILNVDSVAVDTSNSATPSVAGKDTLAFWYGGATNVTNFLGGVEGKSIRVVIANAGAGNAITLVNGATIVTNTGANKVVPNTHLSLRFTLYGGVWYEDAV